MARIRTIKPEFWTDEVVVKLPFEARLLFIGLWNFCDDYGCIKDEPGRIQLQVFPGDASIDVCALIDLLVASELVERLSGPSDARFLVMRSWEKHQKVDNPSKIRALDSPRESYRKIAIPSSSRRSVAMKYGCKPGQRADAQCYFCGAPGEIWWPTTTNGKPGSWVAFSELEIDHFEPEKSGGTSDGDNLVLSCRCCNRSRRDRNAHTFILKKTENNHALDTDDRENNDECSRAIASAIDDSLGLAEEGKGKEWKGKEGKGEKQKPAQQASSEVQARDQAPAADAAVRFDAAEFLVENGADPQTAADYLALRKAKKATSSRTALRSVMAEAEKAGLPLQDVLTTCCARGWVGFKAEWADQQARAGPRQRLHDQRKATLDELTGRNCHDPKTDPRDITAEVLRIA